MTPREKALEAALEQCMDVILHDKPCLEQREKAWTQARAALAMPTGSQRFTEHLTDGADIFLVEHFKNTPFRPFDGDAFASNAFGYDPKTPIDIETFDPAKADYTHVAWLNR